MKSASTLISILLFTIFSSGNLNAQSATGNPVSKEISQQISLQHDNDFLTLSDRYYSSGLFLSYTKSLRKLEKGDENHQFSVILGQEIFTPSNITTTDISEQDRPYVGFLGINSSWSRVRKNRGIEARLLIGLAGNNSGAGGFQRWYHNFLVVSDPPVWVGEMNNSFHANLYLNIHREWRISPLPFSVSFGLQPELAFGTRDQYGQLKLMAFFGRRNRLMSSMAYRRIGNKSREIFFSLEFGYRQVFYNGMLQGNPLGDDSVLLIDSQERLLTGAFTLQHRYNQNEYRLGYHINSAEAPETQSHKYISLSFARNF
ncbi:lipid A deacylase LpxR family protein [Muriicola soli]|uniref:lipid A deacylase LpxR family protein n=1 Tax=Muriicola soli TaxID=2507538 RepID=UPI0013EDFC07|nr:lipid A-modifier LpxR family protein [Muriicola soli]